MIVVLARYVKSAFAYGRTIAIAVQWVNRKNSIVRPSYMQDFATKICEIVIV